MGCDTAPALDTLLHLLKGHETKTEAEEPQERLQLVAFTKSPAPRGWCLAMGHLLQPHTPQNTVSRSHYEQTLQKAV